MASRKHKPTELPPKYISEFAISMVAGAHAFANQQNLDSEILERYFGATHPCHIYMICRRPRLSIRPEDTKFRDGRFQGHITCQHGTSFKKVGFDVAAQNSDGWIFRSEYPFDQFEIAGPDGNVVTRDTVAQFLPHLGASFQRYLDLEVLYVGQAFGQEGSRTAPDRLIAHSTLLKIYANALSRTPDMEIRIGLWSFNEPVLIARIDGTIQNPSKLMVQDDAHVENVLGSGVTLKQRINFTEAALIRYFRPEYNEKFKDTFPNPAHTSYSECYDLDINSVVVELDTSETETRLWSESVAPKHQHLIHFALHSRADRMAMFDFAMPDVHDSKQTEPPSS